MKPQIENTQQWNIIERPDGTLWIQGTPDEQGWREVCSLPIWPSRDRAKVWQNARLLAASPELLACVEHFANACKASGVVPDAASLTPWSQAFAMARDVLAKVNAR